MKPKTSHPWTKLRFRKLSYVEAVWDRMREELYRQPNDVLTTIAMESYDKLNPLHMAGRKGLLKGNK